MRSLGVLSVTMLAVITLCFTLYCLPMTGHVFTESSVDSAVTQLNAAVSEAVDLAVPYKCIRKSKYPCWRSSTLKYYI
jgi:hypothetical protein